MTGRSAAAGAALDKLESAYGRYVAPGDAVEAGILAFLAAHAPEHSTPAVRDRLRAAFADWNEMRVADPWDITVAMECPPDAPSRAFARAALRFLESLHQTINRCNFEVPAAEPKPDWVASMEKVRGASPAAKACVLAFLDAENGGWHATGDIVKAAAKLGIGPKTTSAAKVAQGLAAAFGADDRMRAHYLLASYGARGKDDADPMAGPAARKKAPAKPAAKKKTKA
ncbi:MAG: hypothetical protein HMLKMBBP_03059 [Planctomycetes bacterium]|nr:hypothetical protein [Planctomycetota bacterium]